MAGDDGDFLLGEVVVWVDGRRGASLNMAIDALLPSWSAVPVLRFYGWERAAVSIGYFTPWRAVGGVGEESPRVVVVRRPSGGGVVDHRVGRTFSLAVPRGDPAALLAPRRLYEAVHGALGESLGRFGVACRLVGGAETAGGREAVAGQACFRRPVVHDLVDGEGRKMAGGAQKRTRDGFLHQGQLVLPAEVEPEIPVAELAAVFAGRLARRWRLATDAPDAGLLERARARAEAIYDRDSWTRRR